jgi:transposase-like protein
MSRPAKYECPYCESPAPVITYGRQHVNIKCSNSQCGRTTTVRNGAPAARSASGSGSGQLAETITIPQYRWGSGRLY